MSNVVFQVNIKGHRTKPEFDLSTKSWAIWCEKNNLEHFVLTEPIAVVKITIKSKLVAAGATIV